MRIAVFAGAASGRSPRFIEVAATFGAQLAAAGVQIVYGGARIGLMGALADAALAAGGAVTGVIPRALVDAEIAHAGLTDLRVVGSLHERKAIMVELADAFVALPGGTGTLDELFEAWTWQQLGLHHKPVVLLNVDGYWDRLCAALEHMRRAGFIRDTDHLAIAADTAAVLDAIQSYAATSAKWGNRSSSALVSVGWLCVQDERLLAVRSRDQNLFFLPGGKPEAGETGPQALARELAEELHLDIDPTELTEQFTVYDVAHGHPGRQLLMTCYTGPANGHPRPGREIAETAWLTLADGHRCAPALRQALHRTLNCKD